MKKNILFHYFFIILLIFFNQLFSQKITKIAPPKTQRTDVSMNDYKYIDISNKNYALLEKQNGDISEFYVCKLEDRTDVTKSNKEKLFSFHKDDRVKYIQFSKSGKEVVFRKGKRGEKKSWEIHDISTKKSRIIDSKEGSVISASIFDINNIVYLVDTEKERSKIYLIKDNSDPVFVDNGFGGQWSPNRNYLLLKTYQNKKLSLVEQREFGHISRDEFIKRFKARGGIKREIFSRYSIYNTDGEKLLVLNDFDLVDWIQWAPDNQKIVLQERGDLGFKIIYLRFLTGNNIIIDNVYHFPGFHKNNSERVTVCREPKWSPNGKKILFLTEVEGSDKVLYNNAYVLEDQSYKYFPLIESSNVFIPFIQWTSKQSILFYTYNIHEMTKKTIVSVILCKKVKM